MSNPLCLGPIPEHLRRYNWYAPHQAWLREQELEHHDPGDAVAAQADLRGAGLRGAALIGAMLDGADLRRSDLRYADLRGSSLGRTYLRGAWLIGADLSGSDLRSADLCGSDLHSADLSCSVLRGSVLIGADLGDADLHCADLRNANLCDAAIDGGVMAISHNRYQCRLIGQYLQFGCECRMLEEWTSEKQSELCELHDENAAADLAECVRKALEIRGVQS